MYVYKSVPVGGFKLHGILRGQGELEFSVGESIEGGFFKLEC